MEKRKLILCRGIQGSGKSYFARSWVLEDPDNRVRFNNDDIRNMLGKYWVPSREKLVTTIKMNFLIQATNFGYNIIIDNMNLNPKEIGFYKEFINSYNKGEHGVQYEIEFKDFWTPVDECIRRDKMRPNPIGEEVIKQTWKRYRSFILQEQIKQLKERKLKQNDLKPKAIVLDMDATLCLNTTGRPFYGEGAAEGMLNDEPIPEICELVRNLQKVRDYAIIIISGREDTPEIRKATETWLHNQDIWPTEVLLRSIGDYSNGEVVKKNLIDYVLSNYNVQFIIDDNNRCVKMYRDMGLTVLQPNEGSL